MPSPHGACVAWEYRGAEEAEELLGMFVLHTYTLRRSGESKRATRKGIYAFTRAKGMPCKVRSARNLQRPGLCAGVASS